MKPGQVFEPLANCHAPGLFSIPLEQDDKYVRRMFIDTFGRTHTVAPHSHRYSLHLQMVHGRMTHSLWFEESMGPLEMYVYRYASPLLSDVLKANGEVAAQVEVVPGGFILIKDEPTRFAVESTKLGARTHTNDVMMRSGDIHSLVTHPGTSWIITEYLDDNECPVTLHHTPDYAPDLSGLYTPIEG